MAVLLPSFPDLFFVEAVWHNMPTKQFLLHIFSFIYLLSYIFLHISSQASATWDPFPAAARWPSCRDWIAAYGQLIDGQKMWPGSNCCCRVRGHHSWSHSSCSLHLHFEAQRHQPAVLSLVWVAGGKSPSSKARHHYIRWTDMKAKMPQL